METLEQKIVKMTYEVTYEMLCEKEDKTLSTSVTKEVAQFIDIIRNNLDTPYYASKLLTSYGIKILKIVDDLEKENELLKKKIAES